MCRRCVTSNRVLLVFSLFVATFVSSMNRLGVADEPPQKKATDTLAGLPERIRIAAIAKAKELGFEPVILTRSKEDTIVLMQGSVFTEQNGRFVVVEGNLVANAGEKPENVFGTVLKQGEYGLIKNGKCEKQPDALASHDSKSLPLTTDTPFTFLEATTIDIGNKGEILAKEAGVLVKDRQGRIWQSRKWTLNGKEVFAFFPKETNDGPTGVAPQIESEPAKDAAVVTLVVPDATDVAVNDKDYGTTQRRFTMSPLQAGRRYEYRFKVRFLNGSEATRVLSLTGGETVRLEIRDDDVLDLLAQKLIDVQVRGQNIQGVNLTVTRKSDRVASVRIPAGTLFVSRNTATQNMVTIQSAIIEFQGESSSTWVNAACANRARAIPGASDTFEVRRLPNQDELVKLTTALNEFNGLFVVKQAAVWIVTDNATFADLGILSTGGGVRAIKADETVRAMKIAGDAGIMITSKAIWRDRQQLLNAVSDPELKQWLTNHR